MPLDAIPVKTYHTLFCPVYVLDARAQSAGGPGPPKWEPRSRIGVYLGHSPFHAGSVALVFNPRTGRVSPQYHVVFDDTFSTVPYMDAGTEPPHWHDLLKYSSEKATDEDFDLAKEWMNMVDKMPDQAQVSMPTAEGCITDPFVVVSEGQPTTHPAGTNASPSQTPPNSADLSSLTLGMQVSEGGNKRALAKVSSSSNAGASSLSKTRRLFPSDNVVSKSRDDFGANATPEPTSNDHLLMPSCINLHESGLRCSPRLQEQAARKNDKAHVTWASNLPCVVTLLTLFSLVSDYKVHAPSYALSPNASYTD